MHRLLFRRAATASVITPGNRATCRRIEQRGGLLQWGEDVRGNSGLGLPSRGRVRCAVMPSRRAAMVSAVPQGNRAAWRHSPVGRGGAGRRCLSSGERAHGATVVWTSPQGDACGALSYHFGGRRWSRPSLRGIARCVATLRWGEQAWVDCGVRLLLGGRARCAATPSWRAATAPVVPSGNRAGWRPYPVGKRAILAKPVVLPRIT